MKIRFCFLLLLVLLIPCLSASAEEMHYDPGFYTFSPDHLVYEPEPELVKPSSYEPTSYTYSSGYVIPDEGFRTYIPEESGASSDDSSESPVRRPETVRKAQDMEGTAKILKDRVIVRKMPSVYSNSVRILSSAKGESVRVLQKIINSSDIVWYLVELEDGEQGYLVGSVLDVDAVPLERPDAEPPAEEEEKTESMTVMLSLPVIAYAQTLVPSPDDPDRMIIRFEPQIFYEEQEVTLPVYQIDPAADAGADEPDHQKDKTEPMEFDPDSPD